MTRPRKSKPKAKHPGGRPRHEGPDRRDFPITMRLNAEMVARLDALRDRVRVPLTRTAIAHAVLSVGLDVVEQDPARMLQPARKGKS